MTSTLFGDDVTNLIQIHKKLVSEGRTPDFSDFKPWSMKYTFYTRMGEWRFEFVEHLYIKVSDENVNLIKNFIDLGKKY